MTAADSKRAVQATVLAVSTPLVFLFDQPPSSAILIRLCLVGALFIAVSCYRGLRALRAGSRKGFVLKVLLPLVLQGASTVVVFIASRTFFIDDHHDILLASVGTDREP